MKVKIISHGAAAQKDIEILEEQLGCQLQKEYKQFVQKYDSAQLEENSINGFSDISIGRFVPLKEVFERTKRIDGFPKESYVIAEIPSGDYLYMKKGTTAVFIWEHEVDSNDNPKKIANSFSGLLKLIIPFDVNSFKFDPNDVISVEIIDPNFKPKWD